MTYKLINFPLENVNFQMIISPQKHNTKWCSYRSEKN